MIDNQTAQATMGNIFDYVLIASERVREINRQRDESGESALPTAQYKKLEKAHIIAGNEIEAGLLNRDEYMRKVARRSRRQNKPSPLMR